jgi:16S rRNA (guanine966-N2)-methyltransferase
VRVISGSAKGRTLKSPGAATRPITDRAKESLFNILSTRARGANVLDLFAGAGSVGIEALSRGARAATFVELDREALKAIRDNLTLTRLADRGRIVRMDVFKFLRGEEGEYDLIYVAPPQYHELWAETLGALDRLHLLSTAGVLVAQIDPKEFHAIELKTFELFDSRKYGNTMLCFYRNKK